MKSENEKLIGYIQKDIQLVSHRLSDTRTGDKLVRNWLEGVIAGLEFALAHAKQHRRTTER